MKIILSKRTEEGSTAIVIPSSRVALPPVVVRAKTKQDLLAEVAQVISTVDGEERLSRDPQRSG